MEIDGMKEEFFEWLSSCPVQWVLSRDDTDLIDYIFYKEEKEQEE